MKKQHKLQGIVPKKQWNKNTYKEPIRLLPRPTVYELTPTHWIKPYKYCKDCEYFLFDNKAIAEINPKILKCWRRIVDELRILNTDKDCLYHTEKIEDACTTIFTKFNLCMYQKESPTMESWLSNPLMIKHFCKACSAGQNMEVCYKTKCLLYLPVWDSKKWRLMINADRYSRTKYEQYKHYVPKLKENSSNWEI